MEALENRRNRSRRLVEQQMQVLFNIEEEEPCTMLSIIEKEGIKKVKENVPKMYHIKRKLNTRQDI